MNIHHGHGLETPFQRVSAEQHKAVESAGLSAFMVLPIGWTMGHACQTPASAQNALFLFACQHAAMAVMASRRRRQVLFARGVHLWN
jgi:hypothetical protein